MKSLVFSLAIGWFVVHAAGGAEPCTGGGCGSPESSAVCCGQCGGHSCHKKVCVVVCATEEVKKTVWEVKCSEFCVPSPRFGRTCGGGCDAGCAPEAACATGACASSDSGAAAQKCPLPPKCGPVRTKKELVKKEITCKVPVYKCVVVCCGVCPGDCGGSGCGDGGQAAPATVTPAPEPANPAGRTTLQPAPLPPVLGASYRTK